MKVGVMLDVSRDKVPTMATLRALVERLAAWGVGQLQLYMEHTFAYPGHEVVWRHASPFTPEEIRSLDEHCRMFDVDLVPNQNCLGHLERWLRHEPYRAMAIRPDGWTDGRGRVRPPTTIDPSRPESLAFVRSLLAMLLPSFSPGVPVHVGLDEPWELPDERFDDYVAYIAALRASPELAGREMFVWGDIVATRGRDGAAAIPRDGVTVCEWGYEASHPFEERARVLHEAGLRFWLCPGTSSWNTLVGRWRNARENIASALRTAEEFDADGVLVTDWGDNGHLQYLPVSEPHFAFAAGAGASASADIFGDPTGELIAALRELGDVHRVVEPQLPNTSVLALAVISPRIRIGEGVTGGISDEALARAGEVIAAAVARLDRARPTRDDGALVVDEIRASAELLSLLVDDQRLRLRFGGHVESVPPGDRAVLAERLEPMIARHRELWLSRNRPGGLDDSCSRLTRLRDVWREHA